MTRLELAAAALTGIAAGAIAAIAMWRIEWHIAQTAGDES